MARLSQQAERRPCDLPYKYGYRPYPLPFIQQLFKNNLTLIKCVHKLHPTQVSNYSNQIIPSYTNARSFETRSTSESTST